MPSLARRLKLIRDESAQTAAALLLEALPHVRSDELEAICEALLSTQQVEALTAVVRLLHRITSDDLRSRIITSDGPMRAAVASVVETGQSTASKNALEVIEQRGDPQLADLLLPLLDSPHERVPGRAAEVLLSLVVNCVGDNGRRRNNDAIAKLDRVLSTALATTNGRRLHSIPLAAAVLASRPGPALRAILNDADDPLRFAIQGVPQQTRHPLVRRNLIRWLGSDLLGPAAGRWMHQIEGEDQYIDLLRDGHLLAHPRRKKALRRIERAARCVPDIAVAVNLPPPLQSRLVDFIAHVGLSSSRKVQYLADFVAMPSPTARLKALQLLLGNNTIEAERAVGRFCSDRETTIARLAADRLLDVQHLQHRSEVVPAASRLRSSPHVEVTEKAVTILSRSLARPFFDHWLQLSRNQRIAAAHSLLVKDRERFVDGLRDRLNHGTRAERLAVIYLCRRLGLTVDLKRGLIEQIESRDNHVASAATAALGASEPSPDVVASLRQALMHFNPRVQANAVESLTSLAVTLEPGQHRTESEPLEFNSMLELVQPLLVGSHNRVRANCVASLTLGDRPAGLHELRAMLTDADPVHRISALWVARRTRSSELLVDVRRISTRDRLAEVRTRAGRILRMLERQSGHATTENAPRTRRVPMKS